MKSFKQHIKETYADSGIGRWMKQSAGGEPGWDRYNEKGERAGKCGDAKDGDAYSACLSPEKAKKLGKKGVADFVRRKRKAQKKAGDSEKGGEQKKGQKPVFVKTKANEETLKEKNVPLNPALWKKAIAKAKSKFDVYPSAYANAWASKWYKGEGGKWKKVDEELSETSGEYKGKKVDLDNPFRLPQGSDKKFGVYVKNPKTGNVIMVKFGDPNLSIKRDNPERLKNFRARHNCDQKTDKTTPGYWSCKFWEKDSPVSKLLSKGDVTEDVQLDEGIDSLKGWVNPKTKKAHITRKMRPYHVEFIAKKPKDFGLTKKQIMDHLEKRFDAMDAPDPRESAESAYQDILADRVDIDRGIELLAMKKGWYRVVGGKFASIAGEKKLNDKQVGVILSMMENEGLVGDASDVYTLEVGLEYYKEFDDPMIHPSVKYYGEVKGHEIHNLIKGKPRGAKRTEIGATMAMFRGESFELNEAVDPKEMLKIFNRLNKGDTVKVKFRAVMMTASKKPVELVVTSGRRTVGKAKVERIILKSKKNPGGMKYFLYRRGDNVSFATGDMAAIVDEIQESKLDEAAYGHTLWIDPKGKIHDMGSVEGNTHYQWVFNNFTKYFGKKQPDKNSDDVYDVPMQKGWARVRNHRREIDVEVDLQKLNRSQKKTLRDIVDAGPEYGSKGINRPMYIDVWKKNKTSRAGDKAYNNYEEIVDFLSEEVLDEGVRDKVVTALMKLRPVAKLISDPKATSTLVAVQLMSMPVVQRILDRTNHDSLAKVIDLVDFARDTATTLVSHKEYDPELGKMQRKK